MLKRFLTLSFVVLLVACQCVSAQTDTPALGPDEIKNNADNAFAQGDYPNAITNYTKLLTGYPTRLDVYANRNYLGRAYLFTKDFANAIKTFQLNTNDKSLMSTNPNVVEEAYFYLGTAFYSQAAALPRGDAKAKAAFASAVTAYTDLITKFPKTIVREDALYFRALSNNPLEKFADVETDLLLAIKDFPQSPSKPDYYNFLGNVYAFQAWKLDFDKKPDAEVAAMTTKAENAFKEVLKLGSPVPANFATLELAEILHRKAKTPEEHQAAVDAYRKVVRKDDLLPGVDKRIEDVRTQLRAANVARNKPQIELLERQRDRELLRRSELVDQTDPVLRAMIQMGLSFIEMDRYDEARVLLRRVYPLAPDNFKKEIDLQMITAYANQGKAKEADDALTTYQQKYAGGQDADSISFVIGSKFLEAGKPQLAVDAFDRSLKDYPTGKYAALATMRRATALGSLQRLDEAITTLNGFIAKNPTSDSVDEARLALADVQIKKKQFDAALATLNAAKASPKVGKLAPGVSASLMRAYLSAGKSAETLTEVDDFIKKYPQSEAMAGVLLFRGMAQDMAKTPDQAMATFNDIVTKFPQSPEAPDAMSRVARMLKDGSKFEESALMYEKLADAYPASNYAVPARNNAGEIWWRNKKEWAKAVADFTPLTKLPSKPAGSSFQYKIGDVWMRAVRDSGNYEDLPNDAAKENYKKLQQNAEDNFVKVLSDFPEQTAAVSNALQGLIDLTVMRSSDGLIKDSELAGAIPAMTSKVATANDPAIKARIALAEAGLLYEKKQFDPSLKMFKEITAANPTLPLSAFDVRRLGDLLITHNELPAAQALIDKLAAEQPNDKIAQAEVLYGNAALAVKKGDFVKARDLFTKLKTTASWHPKVAVKEPEFAMGMAEKEEGDKETDPAKKKASYDEALKNFADVQGSPNSSQDFKRQSIYAMGQILESQGKLVQDPVTKDPGAVAFYLKGENWYGEAAPQYGAEALFRAAECFENAKMLADARKRYQQLVDNPAYMATPFGAKAAAKLTTLPPATAEAKK